MLLRNKIISFFLITSFSYSCKTTGPSHNSTENQSTTQGTAAGKKMFDMSDTDTFYTVYEVQKYWAGFMSKEVTMKIRNTINVSPEYTPQDPLTMWKLTKYKERRHVDTAGKEYPIGREKDGDVIYLLGWSTRIDQAVFPAGKTLELLVKDNGDIVSRQNANTVIGFVSKNIDDLYGTPYIESLCTGKFVS